MTELQNSGLARLTSSLLATLQPFHKGIILTKVLHGIKQHLHGIVAELQNGQTPALSSKSANNFLYQQFGKLAKQIFGKSWEFGPTGLTPAPLPERWDFFRKFFGNFRQKKGSNMP